MQQATDTFTINWDFVTHITPSHYNSAHTVIFFTTGKYLLVDAAHSTVADMFIKHKEVVHG